MNACGQHNMAHIGFQGMSIKSGNLVAPALQILLGGGVLGNGAGRFSDKVIKVPSKRGPESLKILLNDFESHKNNQETFLDYYDRKGKTYFYDILKHLSSTDDLTEDDFVDWGHDKKYVKAIGVGECAGVVIDLVATLLFESEEKIVNAEAAIQEQKWSDSIYHAYASIVNTAKALLTAEGSKVKTNTQAAIITNFDKVFVETNRIVLEGSFEELVYEINKHEPTEEFAKAYANKAKNFYQKVDAYRKLEVEVK